LAPFAAGVSVNAPPLAGSARQSAAGLGCAAGATFPSAPAARKRLSGV
jgi:hypothetical protein